MITTFLVPIIFIYFTFPTSEELDSVDLSLPEASHLNTTIGFPNIEVNSNFLWLLFSLVSAISWVVYITYYNSRVAGYVITRIINRIFISDGYFKIGSFIVDALAGKVMFRDVVYITHDYSVRVQDGYLIFRWWRSYVPKDVSEDLSHSDTRLSVVLNGFELHTYNRSEMYAGLEKIFGLESHIFPDNLDKNENKERTNSNSTIDKSKNKQISEATMARTWRDLIPVIKMDISSGRLVFGNRLVPTTLSITIEESHFVYSTKPAVNTLDRFMHFVKCKSENVRVMLVPSPKYTGMLDEPPRYMGEGFVLMSTNDLELYFYMDEPGIVPEQPVQITLANGDVVDSSPPLWGIDIKCGKGTDFSYGPWADRQREHLFKFFYPQTYLPMEVTKPLEPGDKRQMQSFDVRLLLQYEATIDILFSKNKETNATHVNVGAGSYLEITIPWVTLSQGYTTRINGQLLHLDATTSLQFRDFVSTETLEFCVQCHYPLIWNDPQLWELSLTGCKATVNLIFSHKWFFQDLINDWSSKQRPDILHFVPYTWRFGLTLKHCELLTLVNQYNWIDCSSVGQRQRLENTQMALCAYFLHLSFDLPFEEFLPETIPLNFSIQGESIDLSLFIPEYHTSRDIVLSLEKNSKVLSKDGSMTKKAEIIPKWRNICVNSLGWVDFWWVPIGAINIGYVYHPSPPLGPTPQADISTPVKEELLLSPIRFPRNRKAHRPSHDGTQKFDPTILKPDKVTVELEIGPSVLLLYGTALRNFLNFKENIFGDDQMFVDMQTSNSPGESQTAEFKNDDSSHVPLELREEFDERYYRPLEVDVSVIMHDIQAHLLKYCNQNDPPCPVILIERFGFEMKKRYDQTELQLLISPSVLLVSDHINRPSKDKQLNQGRLTLSALQIRGHAMFSNEGCSLDEDTVEYAWLLEIQLGKLSGKLTAPQLHSIVLSLETLVLLMADTENELNSPTNVNMLTTTRVVATTKMAPQNLSQNVQQTIQQFLQQKANVASKSTAQPAEKSEVVLNVTNEDASSVHKMKYKFCRVAIDAVDFWLVESGAALQLWISPVRLSTCNLHGKQVGNGLSAILYSMSLRQLIWQHHKYSHAKQVSDSDHWLEVGVVNFAPLVIESAMSASAKNQELHALQQKFLKTHDAKWKKLSFLWPELSKSTDKCGCSGGCAFFGGNRNGAKFFKPTRKDLDEGINIAAFCVNESGKDPGFGQSILHDGLLIFRTPPYIVNEIFLQDSAVRAPAADSSGKRTETHASFSSPISLNERRISRRFSSTSIRSKDVPYSRLMDTLPPKLDSDSKLHFEKGNLNVPDKESFPKNSISDSKLAVDYFGAQPKSEHVSPPAKPKAVNMSESHHSLGAKVNSDEQLQKAIQRTVSISSENHSEAFFSADEDLNVNSHNSSLRNSVVGSKGTLIRQDSGAPKVPQKKYSSELNILADTNVATRIQDKVQIRASPTLTLKTKPADHETAGAECEESKPSAGLFTPQRCPSSRSVSPRLPSKEPSNTSPSAHSSILHDTLIDSSDSYSSTSYASAVASQEDLTLIDLHMQVNRQIIDSPMLMSSYISHLSQVRCLNWDHLASNTCDAFSVPLFQKNEDGKLTYVGGRFVPTIEKVTEGVTSFKMATRRDYIESQIANNKCATGWDQTDDTTTEVPTAQEEELLSAQGDVGSRTSIIVRLQGDLDIMITPLLLESLQKFVDSLTLTVANLHPSTVINHLHASCISEVEAANILKKRCNVHIVQNDATDLTKCGVYEETIKSQLQAAITLPKVNVTLLQVSIIEEIISFSALDNIRDLTCVSLFSVSFENVTTKLQLDKQQKEVLQLFHRPAVVQMGSKKVLTKAKAFLLGQHSNTIADIIRGEPVSIESCDTKQEELVICLSVGKVHAQLRRLRNESSVLNDAIITAIPAYFSKVFFACSKADEVPRRTDYHLQQPAEKPNASEEVNAEEKLGFIMFECGLEGITLKLVKKSLLDQSGGGNECKTPIFCDDQKEEKLAGESRKDESDSKAVQPVMRDSANVSSSFIEFKTVWFNFAAPPRAPITRKIDYTRLDWNLLSTASPAINAWMNPSNRFAIRVVHMVRTMYRRSTAVVACLMSEALEAQGIHMTSKSRYGILRPLATTLQEDPSCQLCTILQKYILQSDVASIETNLREAELPQLSTLRQGVIVLSRQWKNILHTPLLVEPNQKLRIKPLNVTIAVPKVDEEMGLTDGEASGNEEPDITDEHAMLLHSGIILKPQAHKNIVVLPAKAVEIGSSPRLSGTVEGALLSPQVAVVSGGVESVLTSPSPPVNHRKYKNLQAPSSSRTSVVFPILSGANLFAQKKSQDESNGYGVLKEDKNTINMGSEPSVCTHSSPDLPSSPLHRNTGRTKSSEDLYSWMAKQDKQEKPDAVGSLRGYMESKINTLQTDSSGDDQANDGRIALYPMQDSLRLLDAHFIFQPLLSSLGVMSRQLVNTVTGSNSESNVTSLDALGSNLSLIGNMDTMRIDIIVSEHGKVDKKRKTKSKPKFSVEINTDESYAFMCEKISIEVEMDRKADMTVNDMIKTKNVLYISRGQLKKHTSTILNFNIGVRFIAQRVNMPLLRLLHQITNMYQNVKDTQNELREQQPIEIRHPKTSISDHTDMKHHSSSTSDLQDVHPTAAKLSLKISDPESGTALISPSPSVRSRPQSFAQKLRSTGKSVKGYVNLSEGAGTPIFTSSPSGSALEHISHVSSEKSTGRCWKTIYHLLDLYAAMPDTKTITHRFSMGAADISEYYKGKRKYDILTEVKSSEDIEKVDEIPAPTREPSTSTTRRFATNINPTVLGVSTERTKLIMLGVARIHKTKLLATLSGLKLDAEITGLHSSVTCRSKSRPISLECSITGQIGRTTIKLLEGVAPNQLQTVVKATVGKSQVLCSSMSRKSKDKNSALLTIGAVVIEIPQHPVALHGMVTRSSKQLSSTLQELRVTRTSSRLSRGGVQTDEEQTQHYTPSNHKNVYQQSASINRSYNSESLIHPLVVQFSIVLQSLSITAALLPSLQAQYKMNQLKSMGTTGNKAKFTIDLPKHTLSFTTIYPMSQGTDIHLPTEASIALPVVHVSAEYIPEGATGPFRSDGHRGNEGVVFRQGGYLSAQGDIGVFEHSLTTDLLNHLVFVQNIFMKEVNEVIQKVYGGERPVPIWLEDTEEPSSLNRLLFSLIIKIQRIQLTATTAGSSAVRLETGAVTLELSNRVQNVSGCTQNNSTARLFGRAQVDLNLSLGQLLRNALFEEAEAEFQQFAFFNTRIGLRNAFQDEIIEGEDKEVVLITLKRPLIYVQPVAVDKAILVWLNYKNAYDYWNEKRSSIQQNYEKLQIGQLTSQLSAQHLGTLFLQLTVEDMGICLPLNPLPLATWTQRCIYEECRGAVVVTLESTSISACSSGSLVSKGKFSNLCLRFAEDFETSLDDWKPDMGDCNIMNLCVVSEGTYEVCSRTITGKQCNENAKWFLNVQWQMEGVDIHLDTNVGKQLSALGHTLTSLTGAEDTHFPVDYDSDENDATDGTKTSQESILPSFMLDPTLNNRQRSKLIEKEMNEQAKIINDLRSLGASHGTIELELKRLHELEAMVYKDFRRDMMQKLRRQSVKASTITKGKLGIGNNAYRSKSFVVPSPTIERRSPDNGSYESSPCSGPSRSASLRVKGNSGPRVTFSDTQMCRQSSLPTASSDINIPETQLDWVDHLTVDGEKVELRKKLPPSYESDEGSIIVDSIHDSPTNSLPGMSANVSQAGVPQKPQEPNIDLELDVKVLINSGKCVLHTKDAVREEDIKLNRMRKDRSCSTGLLEFSVSNSPDPSRRNKEKLTTTTSSSRLRTNPHASLVDLTIFHVPGMDVKLHYQSKVITDIVDQSQFADPKDVHASSDGLSSTSDSARNVQDELRIENAFKRKDSNLGTSLDSKMKYGKSHYGPRGDFISDIGSNLKGSTSLHGISNPNYTDSPISNRNSLENVPQLAESYKVPPVTMKKFGIKKASLFAWMTLQSVPEETIVSPHILEFLEQTLEPIPAKTFSAPGNSSILSSGEQDLSTYGNYVYASFPVDVIVYFHMQPSTFRFSCLPVSRVECMLQLPSLDIIFSSKRAEDELLQSEFRDDTPNNATAVGGLSVTGCLSDFSVYIFHPYGGKKSALKEAQWSPLSDSERKDSLSINVEFVKFHLSRSRMLNLHQESTKGKLDQSKAVIRFSTITDIGSASFKYDMRRLTEILAFPKAWYRRSIVRRLFLGDLSMAGAHTEEEGTSAPSVSPSSSRHHDSRSAKSPNLPNREKLKINLDSDRHARLKEVGRAFSAESGCTASPERKNMTSWETLVLFAVNFKKLNVHMNMGNVMGNVTWLTKDFRSEGRLSIGSTGYKNLYIAFGLGGSGLDAKGGIVGGNIEIANIDTFIHIREEPNMEPDHTIGVQLYALELRLDYMATSVLMARVSNLSVNVKDEWKLNRSSSGTFIPTRRPASIFVHGDLSWDQLQIMISKSSTADLLKMFNKLEEFFSQQFNSSKRAFSGFAQTSHAPRISSQKSKEAWSSQQQSTFNDARHHRHWQRVLTQVTGLQLSTMHTPLPTSGTVLGGTMELHGNNISLACFHGINFKSKSWALFSLREPCITFNTEAQEIPSTGFATDRNACAGINSHFADLFPSQDVHVVQTLTCSLGLSTYKTHHSMATVCKVSRNVLFPPQFKSLLEWFQYAFANSQIDEVDRFPSLEKEKFDSIERGRNAAQKQNDSNHNREVIFALPSLQLHLKTEHLQSAGTPDLTEDKPVVECSFITEFEDHIFVTVDAEAFFFLHDLITSYLKEKERVFGTERKHIPEGAKSSKPSISSAAESQAKKSFDDIFTKDWRNYNCKTWHLEPTVRLLSVAGKYIEPYGIDYILQKLGFSHARTTIPKWMQRGFMDPFDAILAVITLKMVQVVKGDGNKNNEKEKTE
ncbi:transmembrane protein KIAA1109 isoform X3 [Photinus pyralis]|nr:transmembrane protein KIAA1109 isoform X3 [Photinus pyralis]